VGLESAKNAQREIRNKLKQKYTREAVDDYHKGTIEILRVGTDTVKGTRKHFKQRKRYKLEKAKYKLQKAEFKLKEVQNKPKIKASKAELKSAKSDFKKHKKNFKSGSRSNVLKARQLRRKQAFRQTNKEIHFKRKKIKSEKKFDSQNLVIQQKIMANTSDGLLALKPAKYTGKKMKASAWQKAVNEDTDNDLMHAIDSTKRRVVEPIKDKFSKPEVLQRQQNKRDKLADKESKSKNRLKKQEDRLQNKKQKPKKKKKTQKNQKSFAERFRNALKKSAQFVKNVYEKEVKSFFACIAVPILILLLVFAFIVMIFSSILSGGGFTLGTYAAQDYDLSEAEKYYTKLAWDMNNSILMVGNSSDWKKGLKNLDVNTKNMKDNPDTWYWGKSDVYNWDTVYDFDTYKLWSFLCAYYYDFDSDNGDIKYWKFGNDTKDLLDEIFEEEYEFVYWYDNTSRWEELDNYNYFGGGSAESGTYYRCETTAYIYDNQPYRYRFKPTAYTSELSQYFDSEGYVCINSNYRVLNPNDDYSLTGYMIMDHRYYSGTQNPFYYKDTSTGQFFFLQNGERHNRSFWGWGNEDAWFMVSPTDTQIWNSSITDACMYGYYEKYVWKTDCRLYYSVKQNKTFDEVIEEVLKSLSHSSERWQYYQLLVGNEDGNQMYGNHQTIHNLLSGNSIRDYTLKQGFGYEVTGWNESSNGLYQGIKVYATSGSALYAPFDCKITDVDTANKKITLRKDDVEYWYDGSGGTKRDTEITIANATLISGLSKGDTLKSGDKFAKTTAGNVNFHIYIDTDGYGWDYIDPRLVLY
jgi:hypothetical protein